jgi:hypothetical protein
MTVLLPNNRQTHAMVDLLTHLVISLLKKSTGGAAETTGNGISGRIGLPVVLMALIPAGLSVALGFLAISDPDPEDRMAGYLVLIISMVFIMISMHFFTYRIHTNHQLLITDSLLMRERIIDLEQPFSLEEKNDGIIILLQNRKKIRISWNVKGHLDFRSLVVEAYRKTGGG